VGWHMPLKLFLGYFGRRDFEDASNLRLITSVEDCQRDTFLIDVPILSRITRQFGLLINGLADPLGLSLFA